MSNTTLHTGCKINLSLDILGRRADGYHELDSVFYPLAEPSDTLHIQETGGEGLTLECDSEALDPQHNTLTKAHAAFAAATDVAPGLRVRLEKGVPTGAGLGGGSADAGALLRWLNRQAPRPLDAANLLAVAAKVGADVPFFLHNTPCRVQGIGDVLTPCTADLSGFHLLLACPAVHVSTPWAYAAWDKTHTKKMFQGLTSSGLKAKRWNSCCIRLANAFEAVVFPEFPILRKHKETLLQHGAAAAVMSGSGASLVALFRDAGKYSHAAEVLRARDVRVFTRAC